MEQQVRLAGLSIESEHAIATCVDGVITLAKAVDHAKVLVNGEALTTPVRLRHMDRLIFGNNHVYLVCHLACGHGGSCYWSPDCQCLRRRCCWHLQRVGIAGVVAVVALFAHRWFGFVARRRVMSLSCRQVVIPSEAESYTPAEDVPEVVDHAFAVMEINKQQVRAMAMAEAKRRAEAEEARQRAEAQVRPLLSSSLCVMSILASPRAQSP